MSKQRTKDERGFTLIELLVVMIVIGILAAIAIPAFLTQRAKAKEVSAKSDIKQIAKEMAAFYVDGTGSLTASSSGSTWTLSSGATPVVTGPLSSGNSVSTRSSITSDIAYCIAVVPQGSGARPWHADQNGLSVGDC